MKKILFVIVIIAIIGLGIFEVLYNAQKPETDSGKKITVVTTLFPQYDFAKAIGGDKVAVTLLLPPGVEAHAYEPKPSDIVKINEADIFVYTGESMEPWAHDIIDGASKNVKIVDASAGIELMKEEAEHDHASSEHPWEWAGAFDLKKGEYTWTFAKVNGEYADPKMKMAISSSESSAAESIESAETSVEKRFSTEGAQKRNTESLTPDAVYELIFDNNQDVTSYKVIIEKPGVYVFFTEHMPTEFEANEHFFKDNAGVDIEPVATEPEESGHHHHHHGGVDPHIWLDFENAKTMAKNISEALKTVDPQNAEFYDANLKNYQAKLTQLDQSYRDTLSSCQTKTIIYGGHYAFGYLAKRYGLNYEAAQGFSPDSEPTAKDLVELTDQIKKDNIGYIFYEELTSPKIAETLSRETSAKLLLLNGAHNLAKEDFEAGVSYISLMEGNLKNLIEGLNCQK